MAELTIRPEEIRDALENFVQSYKPDAASREEVGTVTLAGDGIAKVEGLPSAWPTNCWKFEDGTLGLALNLEEREIGCVVLGEFSGIEEGPAGHPHRRGPSVAVGEGYLGRVVDPLGNPIDGLGEIETEGRRALELQGPHGHAAQVGARADGDGLQGRRRHDPDRPWSASAGHRRPPDRQDRAGRRHDHQPA
ncbi:hypothetical protein LV779_00905 [Streptomyces thinghirensis]|nr:hypothetical protein [Streptomyces thinghirensis]